MSRMEKFEVELTALINRHGLEAQSQTADFIIASYLTNCLSVFNQIQARRAKQHGYDMAVDQQLSLLPELKPVKVNGVFVGDKRIGPQKID